MNKKVQKDYTINYETCADALMFLKRVESSLTDEEQLSYMLVKRMLEEQKFEHLISDMRAILELYKKGFVSNEQILHFIDKRPELQGTTLGLSILEVS